MLIEPLYLDQGEGEQKNNLNFGEQVFMLSIQMTSYSFSFLCRGYFARRIKIR